MKHILLLTIFAFLSISCSDEDTVVVPNESATTPDDGTTNENPVTNAQLNGIWKMTSITGSEAIDANGDGISSTNLASETGCYLSSTITFGTEDKAVFYQNAFFLTHCVEETVNSVWLRENDTVTFSNGAGNNLAMLVTTAFALSGNTLTATTYGAILEDQSSNFAMTYVYTKQ